MRERFVRVLPSAELEAESPGEARLRRAKVARTDVLLARLSTGPVVAFAATCPHQQTDLEGATFYDGLVRCPLHVYLYDPQTGENVVPSRDADPANLWKLKPGYLSVFPVEERDGWVWVGTAAKPPPASYDPARERPPAAGLRAVNRAHAAAPADPVDAPEARDEALRVQAGAVVDLRVPTVARPGFIWRLEGAGTLLAVVEERFEPADPPHHLFRLAARTPGEVTVRCIYARPWDATPAEVRTYRVTIESVEP